MSNADPAGRPPGTPQGGSFILPFLAVVLALLVLSCAAALQRLYR
jgi:hypothetical protein